MSQRVRISQILVLVDEANLLGADLRVPHPHQRRPLNILQYESYENPNPTVHSFRTLTAAKNWLTDLCAALKTMKESSIEVVCEYYGRQK